ncbi:MAG: recombination mediator RecR [Desulfuromonadales bacterium]
MLNSIPSFARLVSELAKFPGVGNKTATRLAFFLLRQSKAQAEALATAILDLQRNTRFCSICFHITEQDPCSLCSDPGRDESLLCIVEEPQALLAIERSRSFKGHYHVLHGALSPLDGIGPEDLKIAPLIKRLEQSAVQEIIIATNFTVEGDATALYLAKLIQPLGIRLTRLAYGIPMGSELEYVDEATVNRAVEGRRDI